MRLTRASCTGSAQPTQPLGGGRGGCPRRMCRLIAECAISASASSASPHPVPALAHTRGMTAWASWDHPSLENHQSVLVRWMGSGCEGRGERRRRGGPGAQDGEGTWTARTPSSSATAARPAIVCCSAAAAPSERRRRAPEPPSHGSTAVRSDSECTQTKSCRCVTHQDGCDPMRADRSALGAVARQDCCTSHFRHSERPTIADAANISTTSLFPPAASYLLTSSYTQVRHNFAPQLSPNPAAFPCSLHDTCGRERYSGYVRKLCNNSENVLTGAKHILSAQRRPAPPGWECQQRLRSAEAPRGRAGCPPPQCSGGRAAHRPRHPGGCSSNGRSQPPPVHPDAKRDIVKPSRRRPGIAGGRRPGATGTHLRHWGGRPAAGSCDFPACFSGSGRSASQLDLRSAGGSSRGYGAARGPTRHPGAPQASGTLRVARRSRPGACAAARM